MNAMLGALSQKCKNMTVAPSTHALVASVAPTTPMVLYCEVCGLNGHSVRDCHMILVGGSNHDIVNYVNNQRVNPYSNTYNIG